MSRATFPSLPISEPDAAFVSLPRVWWRFQLPLHLMWQKVTMCCPTVLQVSKMEEKMPVFPPSDVPPLELALQHSL